MGAPRARLRCFLPVGSKAHRDIAREGLGEQRLAVLCDRGNALGDAELVAYLRAEADRVLAGDPAFSPPAGLSLSPNLSPVGPDSADAVGLHGLRAGDFGTGRYSAAPDGRLSSCS